jgi:proteasome accessory factor A
LVLRMIEEGVVMRDLSLENPIRAIREISHDLTGQRKVRLVNGREASALDIQGEYFAKARDFVENRDLHTPAIDRVLDLWERTLKAVESGDLSLVEREIDWVIKYNLIERYRAKHCDRVVASARGATGSELPRHPSRPWSVLPAGAPGSGGAGEHRPGDLRGEVAGTANHPARLRGEFIKRAQERRRDFTVDWVHLKLNDQAQRTVLCKDPFRSHDERVHKLIESM